MLTKQLTCAKYAFSFLTEFLIFLLCGANFLEVRGKETLKTGPRVLDAGSSPYQIFWASRIRPSESPSIARDRHPATGLVQTNSKDLHIRKLPCIRCASAGCATLLLTCIIMSSTARTVWWRTKPQSKLQRFWRRPMLWTLFVVLLVMWLLGFSFHVAGGLIHLLLVVALVVLVINLLTGRRAAV